MILTVCSKCGKQQQAVDGKGKPICVFCKSYDFEEREMDCSDFKCSCGKLYKEVEGVWKSPPFADVENKTFYCGCRGWD